MIIRPTHTVIQPLAVVVEPRDTAVAATAVLGVTADEGAAEGAHGGVLLHVDVLSVLELPETDCSSVFVDYRVCRVGKGYE